MFGYELIVITIMLIFNAFLAAYEMALASVSRARLATLLAEKKKGALEAAHMKDRMEASLAVIQLGITLVGAVAAATGGAGVGEKFAPYLHNNFGVPAPFNQVLAIIVFIVPLTFVTMIFGELVPKMFALNNKEWMVLHLSPFMKSAAKFIEPIVSVIEIIVKRIVNLFVMLNPKDLSGKGQSLHDLKAAVSLARAAKILGAREERILLSAASLSLRAVKEIVVPAQDISMIGTTDSLMDALLKAHTDMHTRFPVASQKNDPQTIEGYINFKDIVVALKINPSNPVVREIIRPIKKVPENLAISQLLETMIQEKIHIVLVMSKDEKVLGMVTLEDVTEELVGEIEDEFDRLPGHIHACGTAAWIMGGGVNMVLVAGTAGLDWREKYKDAKVPTLAEWCAGHSAKPIEGGEVIEAEGLRVSPRKFRRKKVAEAVVSITGERL